MAKSTNTRHSLRIERMDNGFSVDHEKSTWPTNESEYGGYDKPVVGAGRRTKESWRKIAKNVDELHDLVDESFGAKS